jgi:hypothetical protein
VVAADRAAEHQGSARRRKKGTMMRRTYGLAVAAALVLAIGSITVAFASSSSRGSADHRVQVIRLVAKGVQETNLDLGKKGFSQGDQEVVALNLFRDGKKTGEAGNLCQFVRVTKASATDLCQVDMSLSAGQITAHGLVTSTPAGPGTYFLAITGGTGAYQTAHGQVKITASATNEVPITLYLIR